MYKNKQTAICNSISRNYLQKLRIYFLQPILYYDHVFMIHEYMINLIQSSMAHSMIRYLIKNMGDNTW